MNYLEEAIVDYLNNNPDKHLNSIDIVSYFKLSADKTLDALRSLQDAGRVSRMNGALGGWNGNHYYIATPQPLPSPTPLTLPGDMNSDEATYWISRAQEIFPGEDIKIQIGE